MCTVALSRLGAALMLVLALAFVPAVASSSAPAADIKTSPHAGMTVANWPDDVHDHCGLPCQATSADMAQAPATVTPAQLPLLFRLALEMHAAGIVPERIPPPPRI